jgi:hypothetical protein
MGMPVNLCGEAVTVVTRAVVQECDPAKAPNTRAHGGC